MKNILRISIAAGVAAIVLGILIAVGASRASSRQSAEARPFDMNADGDGNGVPDDFENAYREIIGPSACASDQQSASGEFDAAAMERFTDRVPVSEETRRMRSEMDAKALELLSATSESRQIELMTQIQDLSDRMAENDPTQAAALEYLDRLEEDYGCEKAD